MVNLSSSDQTLKAGEKIKTGSKAEDASRVIVIIINLSQGKYNLNYTPATIGTSTPHWSPAHIVRQFLQIILI